MVHRNACTLKEGFTHLDKDNNIVPHTEEPTKDKCADAQPEMVTTTAIERKRYYKVLELEVSSTEHLSAGINVDPWYDNGAGVSITLNLFIVCICLNLGFWFTTDEDEKTQPCRKTEESKNA